jgi:hypothetical protein
MYLRNTLGTGGGMDFGNHWCTVSYNEMGGPRSTHDKPDMLHRILIGRPERKGIGMEWGRLPKHVAISKYRKVAVLDSIVDWLLWNIRLMLTLKL